MSAQTCFFVAVLRQGNTSVQAYNDKFRGIISQADHHPVLGAEAVWRFKQGLSDRIRTAIAIYGDDDLDTMVMQAKRVDAAFRLETSTHPAASGSANRSVLSAGAKRPAASTSAGAKRAKPTVDEKALFDMRKKERLCTNCRVPVDKHDRNTLGFACPSGSVPPAPAELNGLKGKAKA